MDHFFQYFFQDIGRLFRAFLDIFSSISGQQRLRLGTTNIPELLLHRPKLLKRNGFRRRMDWLDGR